VRAVDTSLLTLAVNRWAPEHARASHVLEALVNSDTPWALPWTVAAEFVERVTHPHAVVRPLRAEEACGFLELLLASPAVHALAPTSRHPAALREVAAMAGAESGLPPRAETAALLREHGVRELLSLDAGMRRYPFLSVIDPLRDEGESPRRRYRMLRTASRRRR
jgi:predicted nucleic acid-binding protein